MDKAVGNSWQDTYRALVRPQGEDTHQLDSSSTLKHGRHNNDTDTMGSVTPCLLCSLYCGSPCHTSARYFDPEFPLYVPPLGFMGQTDETTPLARDYQCYERYRLLGVGVFGDLPFEREAAEHYLARNKEKTPISGVEGEDTPKIPTFEAFMQEGVYEAGVQMGMDKKEEKEGKGETTWYNKYTFNCVNCTRTSLPAPCPDRKLCDGCADEKNWRRSKQCVCGTLLTKASFQYLRCLTCNASLE